MSLTLIKTIKTATKYFLPNEICHTCHKRSEDISQTVSRCIKSSATKSINRPKYTSKHIKNAARYTLGSWYKKSVKIIAIKAQRVCHQQITRTKKASA